MSAENQKGLTYDEYTNGCYCYSCSNITNIRKGKGICSLSKKKKYAYINHKCKSFNKDKLIVCEVCEEYFRGLGIHVNKIHGISISEYKEQFGYNRTKGLRCESTKKMARDKVVAKDTAVTLREYKRNHKISKSENKGNRYSLRVEGKLNVVSAMQKRDNTKFFLHTFRKELKKNIP